MLFFTSDLHFCHANIIKMCSRPFADVDEMNNTLIQNWNAVVGSRDEIYILGDFLYKGNGSQAREILKKLRGKKYLIKGNHEKYLASSDFDVSLFESVKDYDVINYKDVRFILFHYPILEWQYYHRKSVHLYGHIHKNTSQIPEVSKKFSYLGKRAINVSVDVNDYYPISAEAVYARAFK